MIQLQQEMLNLCSPSLTFGTSAHSPDPTFGTYTVPVQIEPNPIVLHLCRGHNLCVKPPRMSNVRQI